MIVIMVGDGPFCTINHQIPYGPVGTNSITIKLIIFMYNYFTGKLRKFYFIKSSKHQNWWREPMVK